MEVLYSDHFEKNETATVSWDMHCTVLTRPKNKMIANPNQSVALFCCMAMHSAKPRPKSYCPCFKSDANGSLQKQVMRMSLDMGTMLYPENCISGGTHDDKRVEFSGS